MSAARITVALAFALLGGAAPPAAARTASDDIAWERILSERASAERDANFLPRTVAGAPVLEAPGALRARFEADGAHLSLGDEETTLTAVALGRGAGLRALAGSARPVVSGAEVRTSRRDGVQEWWRSLPSGLEHGIDIASRPPGEGPLELEIAVAGRLVVASVSDDAVELRDGTGSRRATYSHLVVLDARGARLPARMSVRSERIVLEIEDAGARYPIVVDPLVTAPEVTLLASDRVLGDRLGRSVALTADGSRALVGDAADDTTGGTDAGSARVFARTGATWAEEARLIGVDGSPFDGLGSSVAISADGIFALAGAPLDDTVSGGSATGTVRVFRRTGTSWVGAATLLAADGAPDDSFGHAVALSADGGRAIVGVMLDDTAGGVDAGSARVFVRSGSTWTEEQTLLAPDGAAGDDFGFAVALSADGSRAIVGAPRGDTAAGPDAGSAYSFVRAGTLWTYEQTLRATGGASGHGFGSAVALSSDGTTALIGAPQDDRPGANDAGSARVWTRSGAAWTEEAALFAPDAATNDTFGGSVALTADGGRALIGSSRDDTTAGDAGSARVFVRSGGTWTQAATLTAADGAIGDGLGGSVAISSDGTRALCGASLDDSTGSARVFLLLETDGSPCATDVTCASGFCTDGVCCGTRCGGGTTDCQACSAALTGAADGMCGALSPSVAPATVCRPAAALCDVAESCSASSVVCPADALSAAGSTCRPASDACDVAEVCTGASAECPLDLLATSAVVCRAAAAPCDQPEACDGSSGVCPPDAPAPASTVCRVSGGACDAAEVCDGASFACPGDVRLPAGTSCGGSVPGSCSSPGVCDGSSAVCPGATPRPAGTVCSPASPSSACDTDDVCDGVTDVCRAAFAAAGTECAPATGEPCDAIDHCTGTSAECRSERLAGTVCRASSDPACDAEEVCDGVAATCPADVTTCGAIDASTGDDGGAASADSGALDAGAAPAVDAGCACRVARPGAAPAPGVVLLLVALGATGATRRRRAARGRSVAGRSATG